MVGAGTNGIVTSGATSSDFGTSVNFESSTTTPARGRSKTPENCRASSKRTRTPASASSRVREEVGGEDGLEDIDGGAGVERATMRCSGRGARRGRGGRGSGADKRAACDRPKRVRGRLGKVSKPARSVNGGNGVVNGVAVLPVHSGGDISCGTGEDQSQGGDEVASDQSANGGNSEPSPDVVQGVKLRTKASAKLIPNGAASYPQKNFHALSTSHALPSSDTSVRGGFVASIQRGKRSASVQVAGGDSAALGAEKSDCRRWANGEVVTNGSDMIGEFRSSGGVTNDTANATTKVATRSAGFGLLPVSGASVSSSADTVSSIITKASSNGKSSSFPVDERASSTSSPSPCSSSSSCTSGGASFGPASASYVMRAPPSHGEGDGALISGVETESAMDVELKKLPGQGAEEPKGVLSAALQGSPLLEAYHGSVSDVADGAGKEKDLGSPHEGSASALATNVRANGHVGGARVALRRG